MYEQVGQSEMSLGKNNVCDLANMLWVNWEGAARSQELGDFGLAAMGSHGNLTLS